VVVDSTASNLRKDLEYTPDAAEFKLNKSLRGSTTEKKAGRHPLTQSKPRSLVPYTQIHLAKDPFEKAMDLIQKAEILSQQEEESAHFSDGSDDSLLARRRELQKQHEDQKRRSKVF